MSSESARLSTVSINSYGTSDFQQIQADLADMQAAISTSPSSVNSEESTSTILGSEAAAEKGKSKSVNFDKEEKRVLDAISTDSSHVRDSVVFANLDAAMRGLEINPTSAPSPEPYKATSPTLGSTVAYSAVLQPEREKPASSSALILGDGSTKRGYVQTAADLQNRYTFMNADRDEKWAPVEVTSKVSPGWFSRDALYYLLSSLSGGGFPEDAQKNDYILGIFLKFLKLSALMAGNWTVQGSIWTLTLQLIEKDRWPGGNLVPHEFNIMSLANGYLTFVSTIVDGLMGERKGLPPASAVLFTILATASLSKLGMSLTYWYQKKQTKTSPTSSIQEIDENTESTPLLAQVTEPPIPEFVRLVDRYNDVNTWRNFRPLIISNTLGTLFVFLIVNLIALFRVPEVPDPTNPPTGPLADTTSYQLLLTLPCLLTIILPAIFLAKAKLSEATITTRGHDVGNQVEIKSKDLESYIPPRSDEMEPIKPPPEHTKCCTLNCWPTAPAKPDPFAKHF